MATPKKYQPKNLPFKGKLEGISEKTLAAHHDKLYQGYVNKMNEIDEELEAVYSDPEKLNLGNQTFSEVRSLKADETFAVNGVYLHEHYFEALGGSGKPKGKLADALAKRWGSAEKFISAMSAVAMSVRGWAVLAWDTKREELKIYGCDAHNQGGVWGAMPVIVLDVYEHAYFIDHGPDRAAYIKAFWDNMDWDAAERKYAAAKMRLA